MLYSYYANAKKNSAQQILTGTIKEVKDLEVIVTVPIGFNKEKDFSIAKADLSARGTLSVGMPIAAIGLDNEEGAFEIVDSEQAKLSPKAAQFLQFDRCKENKQKGEKTMEHDAFLLFPMTKSAQVMVDTEKKSVVIPANVDNSTVWLRFYENKFNHFDNYEADGRKHLGLKAYAEMLQKRLDGLKEDEVLLVSYAGRFEDYVKETKTNVPCQPQEKDGKLVYSVFGNGENALNTLLNTSMAVSKSFVPMSRSGQQVATAAAATEDAPAEVDDISEEEEQALIAAMGQ